MKKFSLAMATAGLTATLGAFAALPTDAAPFQLVVPNLKSGLDITLTGLLLQPTNTDQDYGTLTTAKIASSVVVGGTNKTLAGASKVQTVDPDYDFGFSVGLGYTFEDSGNDVRLVWTHFNQNDTHDVAVPANSVLTSRSGFPFEAFNPRSPEVFIGQSFEESAEASGKSTVTARLDSIDLNVGQYVDMGTRLQTRFFAGLRGGACQ